VQDPQRDRARGHCICAWAEWRLDRDGEPSSGESSQSDYYLALQYRIPNVYGSDTTRQVGASPPMGLMPSTCTACGCLRRFAFSKEKPADLRCKRLLLILINKVTSEWEIGLFPESGDESLRRWVRLSLVGAKCAELGEVLWIEVGGLMLLPVGPQVFDGIEFGCLGRQKIPTTTLRAAHFSR
jgi:hypothetical protein